MISAPPRSRLAGAALLVVLVLGFLVLQDPGPDPVRDVAENGVRSRYLAQLDDRGLDGSGVGAASCTRAPSVIENQVMQTSALDCSMEVEGSASAVRVRAVVETIEMPTTPVVHRLVRVEEGANRLLGFVELNTLMDERSLPRITSCADTDQLVVVTTEPLRCLTGSKDPVDLRLEREGPGASLLVTEGT